VIKARVTSKSPVRTWTNARGEGKLFSMDLIDESGEIRATAFKEQCEKFYDMIEVTHNGEMFWHHGCFLHSSKLSVITVMFFAG
jgi:ssDNA-binding replication factor A large subunit